MYILLAAHKITYYRSRTEDSPIKPGSKLLHQYKTTTTTKHSQLTLVGGSGKSKLFLRRNFEARTDCLFKTDVRLINCQIRGSQKGKD